MRSTPVTVLCLSVIAFTTRPTPASAQESTPADEKAKARSAEHSRRNAEDEQSATKRQFERFLSQAEGAAELFARLDRKAAAWSETTKALLKNDDGKRLAADGPSLIGVIRIYREGPVPADEISARRRVVDSILSDLRRESERPDVGFLPSEKTQDELFDNYYWARGQLARLSESETRLQTLIAKAPRLDDVSKARTLEEAIRDHDADYLTFINNSIIKGKAEAKEQSEQIVVEKARLAELERARDEADRLYKETLAKIETMRIDFELELKRKRAEEESRLAAAEVRYKDLMAELERMKQVSDAERHSKNVDAELKSGQIVSEAEKKRLIAKCSEPEVQTILAPFLDKGYFRPSGNMHGSGRYDVIQPVPISFGDLQKLGALNPTGSGADMLHKIASAPVDSMRTRWPGYRKKWQDDPGLREMVPKAQKLLNELGPTLVELEMLQP
jgi:hypothetical protein